MRNGTAARRSKPTLDRVTHGAAVLVLVVGIAATLARPFAGLPSIPADAGRWFDASYLAEAAAYRGPRYVASAIGLAVRLAVPLLVAFTPWGRRVVAAVVRGAGARPVLAPALVVVTVIAATDLVVLPLQFWIGFVHDGAFGFRTQGLAGWTRDWIVLTVPVWGLMGLLAAGGWWLARRLPTSWPAVGGLAAALATGALVLAGPLVIEPLSFQTEPLEPGPVRDAVTRVVERSGVPAGEIVVADASRRSTRQNAYVSGLGTTRRIVLYDTLVEGQEPAIVAQVVAHELAHARHGDLERGTLLGAAGVIATAYALGAVMAWRVKTKRQATPSDPHGAAVVVATVVLLITASLPLQNWVSRQYEAAADAGALELTGDPATYITQRLAVTRANLGDPTPPAWYKLLRSSHPSALERLEMGAQWPLEWRRVFGSLTEPLASGTPST